MNQSFMKERPILPLVLAMSIPNVLSMLINSLYNIVDSYFVAKISENAMTAISLVFPIQNVCLAIAVGFSIGISSLIAILLGREEGEKASWAGTNGIILCAVHGLILTAACIAIIPGFLGMFSENEEVLAMGREYAVIVLGFSIVQHLYIGMEKIYQAIGRMKISMLTMMAGCLANIILDPILIFGMGPIPAMGIAGAALATGLGQLISLVCYIIIYLVKPIPVQFRMKYIRPEKKLIGRLYGVGIPASLSMALPSLLISALNSILAAYSQVYIVVLGIYYKLQTFVYMPANGLIQGIRPLIGYNYGAKEYDRVRKFYHTTLCLSAVIMLAGTAICFAAPEWLMGMFSTNAETIAEGAVALRIISIGFLASAISITSCGSLEGLGMGVHSLIISLLRYVVLIIPVAYLLSRFFGPAGVWNSFWVTELIAGGISYIFYRKFMCRRN